MTNTTSVRVRRWLVGNWHVALIALLLLAGAFARLRGYGDLTISVATDDTSAFVESSRLPLLSWGFLTSNRPATIALLYKLLEPASGYDVTKIGRPAEDGSTLKTLQQGMDHIVVAQTILSIIGWSCLAIATARRIRSRPLKVTLAGTILAFGFSPQMAEWDSILMSEPISLALFVLFLALTFELAARLSRGRQTKGTVTWSIGGAWLLALVVWVFARDSNAYAIPITIAMIALVVAVPSFRRHVPLTKLFVGVVAVLAILFLVQTRSLYASDRWVNPFFNNLIYRVFPDRANLAFFQDRGMPVTPEVLALRTSRGNEKGFLQIEPLIAWVLSRGAATYGSFLLLHPSWTFTTLLDNLQLLFAENRQPYFVGPSGYRVDWTVPVGSMLNLQSSGAVLLDILLTVLISAEVVTTRKATRYGLAWVLVWLLLVELVLLAVSFHGDSLGVVRHALVAVVPLRLSVWMLAICAADLGLDKRKPMNFPDYMLASSEGKPSSQLTEP